MRIIREGKLQESSKEKELFITFIKHMLNVDLSNEVEESKVKGVVTLYTKNLDRNTLVDISNFSRQYEKYKVTDGGAHRLSIIFPNSKFWKTTSFNWTPFF